MNLFLIFLSVCAERKCFNNENVVNYGTHGQARLEVLLDTFGEDCVDREEVQVSRNVSRD